MKKIITAGAMVLALLTASCSNEQPVLNQAVAAEAVKASVSKKIPGKKIGTYTMVKGQDAVLYGKPDDFCKEFLKNLKAFEDEDFMTCNLKFSDKYPEYRELKWEKMDFEKNKKLLEKLSYGTYAGNFASESSSKSLIKSLKEGRTIAYKTKVKDLFPGKENILVRFGGEKCLYRGNYSTIFILNAKGTELDQQAQPFSPNGKGNGGLGNSGQLFYYKDRLMLISTFISGVDPDPKNKAKMVVGDIRSSTHYNVEGDVTRVGVSSHRQCEYQWIKAK